MLAKAVKGKKKIFYNHTEVERENCNFYKRAGRDKNDQENYLKNVSSSKNFGK